MSVKYDQAVGVEIGWGAGGGQHTDITAIVSFGDRLISRDDGHVFPLNIINTVVPQGVHHNQKNYEMEFVLDSFNYPAFYTQRVQAADVTARAIRQGVANDAVEYFAVFIRESDGTETRYLYESGQVYVVGQTHDYTNERGNRHKPTTINLVCLGSRPDSSATFSGVPTGDLSHIRTDLVTTPTGTATNILSVREEYVMQNNIRFVPNVYEGVDMKYDHEWREVFLTFDSDTDIFDAYIDDDGPNPAGKHTRSSSSLWYDHSSSGSNRLKPIDFLNLIMELTTSNLFFIVVNEPLTSSSGMIVFSHPEVVPLPAFGGAIYKLSQFINIHLECCLF